MVTDTVWCHLNVTFLERPEWKLANHDKPQHVQAGNKSGWMKQVGCTTQTMHQHFTFHPWVASTNLSCHLSSSHNQYLFPVSRVRLLVPINLRALSFQTQTDQHSLQALRHRSSLDSHTERWWGETFSTLHSSQGEPFYWIQESPVQYTASRTGALLTSDGNCS